MGVKNRVATVFVTPSVATRLIRALKEPPRDRKKVKNVKHNGNVAFSEVLKIAREPSRSAWPRTSRASSLSASAPRSRSAAPSTASPGGAPGQDQGRPAEVPGEISPP